MARVKLNPIIEQVRGAVGDLVFKRYGDDVVLSRKPDLEGTEPTEAQLAQRERFREAALYGKMVMADPETRALYDDAAKAKGKPVFSLTVADFFNAPSVDEVNVSAYGGATGDEITVRASDDFEVMGVRLTLTDADGNPIENGEAARDNGLWRYTATADVPTGTVVRIGVTAIDRPGGLGEGEAETTV